MDRHRPGRAAGLAVNALGLSEKTTDAVKAAISGATPEQMLALKKADHDFQLQMQALGFKQIADLEAIAADRKDARAMQVANKSPMPAILTCRVGLAFFVALAGLFFAAIPQGSRDRIVDV